MSVITSTPPQQAVPFWRDVRVLRIFSQLVFVLILVLIAAFLYANVTRAVAERGMGGGFGFLGLEAGFEIGEKVIPYTPADSYARAFLVGVLNTLMVSLWGIVLATLLGIVAGVARLSTNWLVNHLALVYIEIIRNTPLLVQLFFWYFVGMVQGPAIQNSLRLPGPIYVSNRGVALPWAFPSDSFGPWPYFLVAGLVLGIVVYLLLRRLERRAGPLSYPFLMGLATFAGVAILSALGIWIATGQPPVVWQTPELLRFGYQGGRRLSPEFAALLIGLVVYTGAFIAEVVRGGIQAVHRGQREAARALGLTNMQVLRLVVFPQAMRVIVPPLTSQYLNLAKNSSLAVAIGYADLYSVSNIIMNQGGRPLPMLIVIMTSYLILSLLTSLFMNWYNRRVQFVER
jgi:general L-amino acid transport system permease protein